MYFVMEYSLSGVNRLDVDPDLGEPWLSGRPLDFVPPKPIRFQIDKSSPGAEMRAVYIGAYPLYRNDVLQCLSQAGVTNLETFDVKLVNNIDGKVYDNYKAVNILGLIYCLDNDTGNMLEMSEDVLFDGIDINEEKAAGALLFRLAENVTAVIVHEKVVEVFERNMIPGIEFYDPAMWSG